MFACFVGAAYHACFRPYSVIVCVLCVCVCVCVCARAHVRVCNAVCAAATAPEAQLGSALPGSNRLLKGWQAPAVGEPKAFKAGEPKSVLPNRDLLDTAHTHTKVTNTRESAELRRVSSVDSKVSVVSGFSHSLLSLYRRLAYTRILVTHYKLAHTQIKQKYTTPRPHTLSFSVRERFGEEFSYKYTYMYVCMHVYI